MRNITMKSLILILMCVALTSCIPLAGCLIPIGPCHFTTTFTPDKLPAAQLGKPYLVEVVIGGGPGPVGSFDYTIEPENSGIELASKNSTMFRYNEIEIQGIPTKLQDIVIKINGSTYGTMVAGHEFEKTFTIKVEGND